MRTRKVTVAESHVPSIIGRSATMVAFQLTIDDCHGKGQHLSTFQTQGKGARKTDLTSKQRHDDECTDTNLSAVFSGTELKSVSTLCSTPKATKPVVSFPSSILGLKLVPKSPKFTDTFDLHEEFLI